MNRFLNKNILKLHFILQYVLKKSHFLLHSYKICLWNLWGAHIVNFSSIFWKFLLYTVLSYCPKSFVLSSEIWHTFLTVFGKIQERGRALTSLLASNGQYTVMNICDKTDWFFDKFFIKHRASCYRHNYAIYFSLKSAKLFEKCKGGGELWHHPLHKLKVWQKVAEKSKCSKALWLCKNLTINLGL